MKNFEPLETKSLATELIRLCLLEKNITKTQLLTALKNVFHKKKNVKWRIIKNEKDN